MSFDEKLRDSRRDALKTIVIGAGAVVLHACAPGRNVLSSKPVLREDAAAFPQGVASADPHPDLFMLWTRAPALGRNVALELQVAKDEAFSKLVLVENVIARAEDDFTVRAIVDQLESNTVYYYRFVMRDGRSSRVGRTWTAPSGDADVNVNFAWVSCQSYQSGGFGAYRHLIRNNPEPGPSGGLSFIMHLGDYIYENVPLANRGSGVSERGQELVDAFLANGGNLKTAKGDIPVAETLPQYRAWYNIYHTDPDLQEARAKFPFVCVWDDHEFSNDGWQSYTSRGSEPLRKMEANRAWFEHVPAILKRSAAVSKAVANEARDFTRRPIPKPGPAKWDDDFIDIDQSNLQAIETIRINRGLRWGKHLHLLLTDGRSYKTPSAAPDAFGDDVDIKTIGTDLLPVPPQLLDILSRGKTANGGTPPLSIEYGGKTVANPRLDSPPVSILGRRQRTWLLKSFLECDATWKIWGNATPLTPFRFDLATVSNYPSGIIWTDLWDGYPNERATIMDAIVDAGITNVISLTGDRHAQFAALIPQDCLKPDRAFVVPEFTVTGISAAVRSRIATRQLSYDKLLQRLVSFTPENGRPVPNLNLLIRHGCKAAKANLDGATKEQIAALHNPQANPHITYADTDAHGYGLASVGKEQVETTLVTVQSASRDYGPEGPSLVRSAGFVVPSWKSGERPMLHSSGITGRPVLGGVTQKLG